MKPYLDASVRHDRFLTLFVFVLLLSTAWAHDDDQVKSPLHIVSPATDTVVAPGQTVTITVKRVGDSDIRDVALLGKGGYVGLQSGPDPLRFEVVVPLDAQPGRVPIQAEDLTARSKVGQGALSAPVFLIVERPDPLLGIAADPIRIDTDYPGDQVNVTVTAFSADHSKVYLTESTLLSFSSDNEAVARVDGKGLVTAWAPGHANIVVSYKNPSPAAPLSMSVPISVPKAIRGDLDHDGKVTADDLSILRQFVGTAATTPNDARDLNHDGKIDKEDVEIMKRLIQEQNEKNESDRRRQDHDRDDRETGRH